MLQSMPPEWQHNFVELLEQFSDRYYGYDLEYTVHKRVNGKFVKDPLSDYERGRRIVKPKEWGNPNE